MVIAFDVKTTPSTSGYKPEGAIALLQSTSSTYLHTNSSDIEIDKITVNFFYRLIYKLISFCTTTISHSHYTKKKLLLCFIFLYR